MKSIKFYKHDSGHVQLVYTGWSWVGFFFGVFWLMYRELWKEAIISFCLSILVFVVFTPITFIYSIVYACVIGAKGNEWTEKRLIEQGYKLYENQ